MNGELTLSKWWRTQSCREAFERAAQRRQERIDQMRRKLEQRKKQLQQDVENWKELA